MSNGRLGGFRYVIVCSYGSLGRTVVAALREAGAAFTVVESAAAEVRDLRREGVPHVVGSPTRGSVLRQAGIDEATAVVCTAPSMMRNVRTVELARRLRKDVHIVARAEEEESRSLLARVGADDVLSPAVEAGRHMVTLARALESKDDPRAHRDR